MRKFFGFICLILVIIPCSLSAETEIKVSGQVRMRNEAMKTFFYAGEEFSYNNSLRTRIGARATVDSLATAVIQLQDSRDLFAQDSGAAASGTTKSLSNVDLHQGYLELHHPALSHLWFTIGRFELAFGNGRIIGTDDWDNVGRAFQGAKIVYAGSPIEATAFGLAGPSTRTPIDSGILIWGMSLFVSKLHLEPLIYYENIDANRYYGQGAHIHYMTDRYTAALYGRHILAPLYVEYNGAYQFGRSRTTVDLPFIGSSKRDIDAWLITSEVGVTANWFRPITYKVGVDATSGYNDWSSHDESAFSAPYASIHSFHGHMTFLEWQLEDNFFLRGAGLKEFYSGVKIAPHSKLSIELAVHNYSSYRDYYQNSWSLGQLQFHSARKIGWEYSATVSTVQGSGFQWELGGSLFSPSREYAEEFHPKTGIWGYSMMTVGF